MHKTLENRIFKLMHENTILVPEPFTAVSIGYKFS